MKEFNKLFARIDLWTKFCLKNQAREASICESVIRILATALWELSFGGQESGSAVHYIGKRPQQQLSQFAGSWFYFVNIDIKKLDSLAKLFDHMELRKNNWASNNYY